MARMPRHWLSGSVGPLWTGPPHPVARRLREGDQVGASRSSRRPAIPPAMSRSGEKPTACWSLGDVLCNINIWNGRVMLREPEAIFTLDPAQNRRSARRFLELEPKLVCFGHGPPLRDIGDSSITSRACPDRDRLDGRSLSSILGLPPTAVRD